MTLPRSSLLFLAGVLSSCSSAPTDVDGGVVVDQSAALHDAGPSDLATVVTGNGRIPPFLITDGETKELDLSPLSSAVAGCKLRFTVQLIGGTIAKLSNLTLVGNATTGVHLRSPSFAIYLPTDLVHPKTVSNDYAGVEVFNNAGGSASFSPSLLLLTDYAAGRYLDFGASLVEPYNGPLDMMPGGGGIKCKNVPGFAAFKPLLMGQGVGLNCNGCHAGGVGGFSTGGFNDSAFDSTSCASILLTSNVTTPSLTSFYTSVAPGGGHGNGKLSAGDAQTFLTGLTTWLNTEK